MSVSQSRSLSIEAATARLRDTAAIIHRRGGLRPTEQKRIREFLLATTQPHHDDIYKLFLRKVSEEAGDQMALLCSVGLGRTAIKGMKDRVRVNLPFEIKDHRTSWETPILEKLIEEHTRTFHNHDKPEQSNQESNQESNHEAVTITAQRGAHDDCGIVTDISSSSLNSGTS